MKRITSLLAIAMTALIGFSAYLITERESADPCMLTPGPRCIAEHESSLLEQLDGRGIAGAKAALLVSLAHYEITDPKVANTLREVYRRASTQNSSCIIQALQRSVERHTMNVETAHMSAALSTAISANYHDAAEKLFPRKLRTTADLIPLANQLRLCTISSRGTIAQGLPAHKVCTSARKALNGTDAICIAAVSARVEPSFISDPRSVFVELEPGTEAESNDESNDDRYFEKKPAPAPTPTASPGRTESPDPIEPTSEPEYAERPRPIPQDTEDYYEQDELPQRPAPLPEPEAPTPPIAPSDPPQYSEPPAESSIPEPSASATLKPQSARGPLGES